MGGPAPLPAAVDAPGSACPTLPSITALVRSLPDERRRSARPSARRLRPAARRCRPSSAHASGPGAPRFAALGVVWALVLLAVVGWVVVVFAARLSEFAAAAVGVTGAEVALQPR